MKKKLLILGGSRYIIPLIKKAHEMGIFVITCDYLPNNYAHKYSDLYLNISILDKEQILKKAIELKIDGISSFACDPGVVTASYVSENMNLPSCGPYESVCILQNKNLFRQFLKKHGFNVPWFKAYSNIYELKNDSESFRFPIIIKPVDSAGSKGVKKVDSLNELDAAAREAFEKSFSKQVILEEYIEQDGYASDSDCFSKKGNLVFCSFSSQYFDLLAENTFTPSCFSWPSKLDRKSLTELNIEIQRLISLLKMNTSIYNIETRKSTNGKTYIMECSPRGGGNRLSEMIYLSTGVDLIENHLKATLGMEDLRFNKKNKDALIAEVILHSRKPGIFSGLYIGKEIEKYVLEIDVWSKIGDAIGGFKGANEAIGTVVLKFNSKKNMDFFMQNIYEYIKVKVRK